MTKRQFLALILPLLVLFIALTVVWAVDKTGIGGPPSDDGFAVYVRRSMAEEFVWGVGDDKKQWEAYFNALNAYVQTFDSYAEVVPPWNVALSREQSSGQYTGVGLRTQPSDAGIEVIGVKPGGPADKAGIAVGDWLVSVEGRSVAEIEAGGEPGKLEEAIRGEPGTAVRMGLRAPDGKEREVEVVRAQIDIGSVFGTRYLDEAARIGYARIRQFQASTAKDFREQVERLQGQGLGGLVLDLRNNGGGLMDQALAIADLFLDAGTILRQRGRRSEYTVTYEAKEKDTLSGSMPLVVLVNHGSASASEILAGALQDHRRAVLVGENTFGKFLVQMVEEVPMEIGTALFKRTTSIYETPLGHHYQRRSRDPREPDPLAGIVPDLYVPTTREQRVSLYRVFNDEFYADWNPAREPEAKDFVDDQLAAALAILKGATYYARIDLPADGATAEEE